MRFVVVNKMNVHATNADADRYRQRHTHTHHKEHAAKHVQRQFNDPNAKSHSSAHGQFIGRLISYLNSCCVLLRGVEKVNNATVENCNYVRKLRLIKMAAATAVVVAKSAMFPQIQMPMSLTKHTINSALVRTTVSCFRIFK